MPTFSSVSILLNLTAFGRPSLWKQVLRRLNQRLLFLVLVVEPSAGQHPNCWDLLEFVVFFLMFTLLLILSADKHLSTLNGSPAGSSILGCFQAHPCLTLELCLGRNQRNGNSLFRKGNQRAVGRCNLVNSAHLPSTNSRTHLPQVTGTSLLHPSQGGLRANVPPPSTGRDRTVVLWLDRAGTAAPVARRAGRRSLPSRRRRNDKRLMRSL